MFQRSEKTLRQGASLTEIKQLLEDIRCIDVKLGTRLDEEFRKWVYLAVSAAPNGLELERLINDMREAVITGDDDPDYLAGLGARLLQRCDRAVNSISMLRDALTLGLLLLPTREDRQHNDSKILFDLRSRWNAFECVLAEAVQTMDMLERTVHDIQGTDSD